MIASDPANNLQIINFNQIYVEYYLDYADRSPMKTILKSPCVIIDNEAEPRKL